MSKYKRTYIEFDVLLRTRLKIATLKPLKDQEEVEDFVRDLSEDDLRKEIDYNDIEFYDIDTDSLEFEMTTEYDED